jgi:hypothetical protein
VEGEDRFSETELTEIASAINEIRDFLITAHHLGEDHRFLVEARLTYLLGAATRLNRIDWQNIALSTLVSIVLYLSLPPTAAGELFRFASVALRHVLRSTTLIK